MKNARVLFLVCARSHLTHPPSRSHMHTHMYIVRNASGIHEQRRKKSEREIPASGKHKRKFQQHINILTFLPHIKCSCGYVYPFAHIR